MEIKTCKQWPEIIRNPERLYWKTRSTSDCTAWEEREYQREYQIYDMFWLY
jgi:hypothetical protein